MDNYSWYIGVVNGFGTCAFQACPGEGGVGTSNTIRRITQIVTNQHGHVGFAKWLPMALKMCSEETNVHPEHIICMEPADQEAASRLDDAWEGQKDPGIVLPSPADHLRLIK